MPAIALNNNNNTSTTPPLPTTNPTSGTAGGMGAKRFAELVNRRHLISKAVSAFQARRETNRVKNEQKAVKVLGIVFVVFVIAWVPFAIANIMSAVCELTTLCFIPPSLLTTLTWFGYISSSINPLIYNAINERFRYAFKKILSCQWQALRKRQIAQTSSGNAKLIAAKIAAHDMSLKHHSSQQQQQLLLNGKKRSSGLRELTNMNSSQNIRGEQDGGFAACRRLLLAQSIKP